MNGLQEIAGSSKFEVRIKNEELGRTGRKGFFILNPSFELRTCSVHRSSFIVHRSRESGFTLTAVLTLMSVLFLASASPIIGTLAAVSAAKVRFEQRKAREAALRDDLFEMRKAIDYYYADKKKYPDSLNSLVSDKYLRRIPSDPITMRGDWIEMQQTVDRRCTPGIIDVHSSAHGKGLDGTAYKSW
jgi:general secretion pathway protein G